MSFSPNDNVRVVLKDGREFSGAVVVWTDPCQTDPKGSIDLVWNDSVGVIEQAHIPMDVIASTTAI